MRQGRCNKHEKGKIHSDFFFKIPGGKRSLGRSWEERFGESVDWIHLAQNNVKWWSVVKTGIFHFRAP